MVASLISGSGLSRSVSRRRQCRLRYVAGAVRPRPPDLRSADQRPDTVASARSAESSVDSPPHSNGTIDQLPQRIPVDVIEALDVQAALPALVRTQPRQRRLMPALELADQVDGQMLAARWELASAESPSWPLAYR